MVMFAEVRKDGQWHKVGKEFVSTYEEMEGQLTDRVFDGRNANLSSFLVSNTDVSGMPSSVSDEIKYHPVFEHYHSIYCYTLSDLLKLNWDEKDFEIGCISEWQYKRLKEVGIEPVNIIKKHFSLNAVIVDPFFMDMLIKHPSLREDNKRYYVNYKHNQTTKRKQCEFFCNESMSGLIKLIPDGGTADDVRIIFSI